MGDGTIKWAFQPIYEERKSEVSDDGNIGKTTVTYFGVMANGHKIPLSHYGNQLPRHFTELLPEHVPVILMDVPVGRRAINMGD